MKYLPVSVSVAAYFVTTGLGAALIPFTFGQDQVNAYFAKLAFPIAGMTSLGSPTYWLLLLSFVVIVPLGAVAGNRLLDGRKIDWPDVPLWIPAGLAAIMTAYCLYRLALAGGLSAHELWDPDSCYQEKVVRRVELQGLLGTAYYGFVYSSLPVLGSYFLATTLIRRSNAALCCFVVLSSVLLWLQLATMHKTPAPLYLGVIWLTLVLCRFGLIHSTIAAAIPAAALFVCLSITQFCSQQVKTWDVKTVQATVQTPAPVAVADASAVTVPAIAAPTPQENKHEALLAQLRAEPLIVRFARMNLMRMAVGFPYYVQTFSDPAQRCGIERSILRRAFSGNRCFPPQVIFSEIYPEIHYVTGLQPAALNVSAYAEDGPLYVIVATIICGMVLGALGALASRQSAVSVPLMVAACLYGYFASQASLTGSLLDSYGLVWLLLPIAAITFAQRCRRPQWIRRRRQDMPSPA